MRRFLIVCAIAAAMTANPAHADHTGGSCEVPDAELITADGSHVEVCYPDGRAGAGTHSDGRTYAFFDPAAHLIPAAHGYALVYLDGTKAQVCSSSGTWKRGDGPPTPHPGRASCYGT